MLRFQIALVAIVLVCCAAFVSCDRGQEMLEPVVDDMMATDDMPTDMIAGSYKEWAHITLPAPVGTGTAHGEGARTVYFNEVGAMANKAGTAYPAGTKIVKEIMDDANTFLAKVAIMEKTDDPMYAAHNGWKYTKYASQSADGVPAMVGGGSVENSMGCHGCHATAENDSVFVLLSKDQMMDGSMGEMPKSQMFEITLTNLTMGEHGMSGQTLSPALFVTHPAGIKLAEEGQPASEALVAQAEGGNIDGLVALAQAADANYKIAMKDMARQYTRPGETATVTVTADMINSSLSVSTMLVSTNDAFIGVFDVPLFDEAGMPVMKTIELMAYDAGSEDNTEMHTDIPGPLGLDPEVDPAGSNARVPTEGGVIMMHPGIQGGADVSEAFAWEGPVAKLMIMPVTDMYNDTADSTDNAGDGNANDGDQ